MERAAKVMALAAAALALGLRSPRAQELVVNPSLEAYTRCPPGIGVIDGYVDDWYRGGQGSTDYANACGYYPTPARTGTAHAGLIPWDASGEYREYLVGTLTAPLQAGVTYEAEFWVILSAGSLRAVQELGAWFSPTRPSWPGTAAPAGVVPQVENASGPIIDKENWTRVSGTFVAAGGEQFVTIGNFHDDAGTTLHSWSCCGAVQSYYDVDDVSLVEVGGRLVDVACAIGGDRCALDAAASGDGRRDFDEELDVTIFLTSVAGGDVTGYSAVLTAAGATILSPTGGIIDAPLLAAGQPFRVDVVLALPSSGSGASCGDAVDLQLTQQASDQGAFPDDDLASCDTRLGDPLGECGRCALPPPCLWRSDLASLFPLAPPASAVFMPATPEGLSLQGPSWQCPYVSGDLEQDATALENGVPLSFYQVDLPVDSLRLEKAGRTIRFRT